MRLGEYWENIGRIMGESITERESVTKRERCLPKWQKEENGTNFVVAIMFNV